ncbi:MAG: hypothetical protein AMXMBFR13_46670 [Phycisphaerae bacterium]
MRRIIDSKDPAPERLWATLAASSVEKSSPWARVVCVVFLVLSAGGAAAAYELAAFLQSVPNNLATYAAWNPRISPIISTCWWILASVILAGLLTRYTPLRLASYVSFLVCGAYFAAIIIPYGRAFLLFVLAIPALCYAGVVICVVVEAFLETQPSRRLVASGALAAAALLSCGYIVVLEEKLRALASAAFR